MGDADRTVKVGSRKSELALIQTKHVISRLKELCPQKQFEIVTMSTIGDQILDKPLPKIGEKSLFTKELEIALDLSRVDFVVHSLKDMPTTLPDGMAIGAILQREDPRDVVIMNSKHKGKTLDTLPPKSIIGTSSLRRTAQLTRAYPELFVKDIRGNLNTRLRKLNEGDIYSAIVLAKAGVSRLGWENKIDQVLNCSEMMYAVGQGALAVECRENDLTTLALLESLHHRPTVARVVAERSFLNSLGGGCSAPVAVSSSLQDRQLTLIGAVWSLDGKETISHTSRCRLFTDLNADDGEPPSKCPYREPRLFTGISPGGVNPRDLFAAEKLGTDLASALIRQGALDIMSSAKKTIHSSINS